MPIHNPGYRPWTGTRVPGSTRPLVIASTGVRRTAKSKWLRRLMFFALLPVLFLSIPFFIFEQAVRDPTSAGSVINDILSEFPANSRMGNVTQVNLSQASTREVNEVRHSVWSYLLLTLFRYPQAVLMVLLIGIAAPPLIAHDIRSRAFLIYFSRPIARWEYILGKLGTVAFFLMMITTLPALVLYGAGVILSPDLSIILDTWDLPFRILLASFVLIVPTTSVALMLSSMTTESRYAGFGWFAMWILGNVAYGVMLAFTYAKFGADANVGWLTLLSPYHTLGVVQAWVFGLHLDTEPVIGASVSLIVATVFSLCVLYRRVSLPMQA